MIALILPVFNESGGIREFLLELDKNLSDLNPHFVVVDDCSTDQTCEILDNLRLSNFPIHSIKNGKNSGHGFSIYQVFYTSYADGYWNLLAREKSHYFKERV